MAVLADRADDSAALAQALDAAVRADLPTGRQWLLQGHTELQAQVLGPKRPDDGESPGADEEKTGRAERAGARAEGRDDGGAALKAAARRHAATYQLTLLGGLEGSAPGALAETLHGQLRCALHAAQIPYQVLYGDMQARVQQARNALMALAGVRRPEAGTLRATNAIEDGRPARLRAWGCEKCSDPECEHQIFQRLIAAR